MSEEMTYLSASKDDKQVKMNWFCCSSSEGIFGRKVK